MRRNIGESWVTILLAAAFLAFPFRATADAPQKPAETAGAETAHFDGRWQTSFGVLTLKQAGDKVEGDYDAPPGKVTGTVSGRKLTFTYQEASIAGEGWFELSAGGKKFAG